jgi:sarcosine oxidase, subunit gamma
VTDEAARTALAHRAGDLASLARLTDGAVEAAEVSFLAQVNLRAHPAEAATGGLPLPIRPNTSRPWARESDPAMIMWLGPDEWLVTAAGEGAALAREVERRLANVVHGVVDVSAARAVVDLRGPGRLDVLATGCPLDLHRTKWAPGRCAQTLLARAQVLLEERDDATRLFVRPSFGDYVVDWLVDAAGGLGLA